MAALSGNLVGRELVVGEKPSIFDVLAQESLIAGLRPAFRFIFKVLRWKYPDRLHVIHRWFEEGFTGFDMLLQNHYLNTFDASFAENFYGMKRLNSIGGKISTKERVKSLFFLSIFPYIKVKLDQLHAIWKEKFEHMPPTNKLKDKLIRCFIGAYPYLNSAMELCTLLLQFGYLVGKSDVHSPWLWLSGVKLINLTAQDHTEFEARYKPKSNSGYLGILFSALSRGFNTIFRVFSRLLGVGLFFIQFLEWWESKDEAKVQVNALPIPPPPPKLDELIQMDPGCCPLCRRKRQNDTILPVSGYIFCYKCIFTYLQTNQSCPVTNLPANNAQLVRIFMNK